MAVNTWDAAVPLDLGALAVSGTIETVGATTNWAATSQIDEPVVTLAP